MIVLRAAIIAGAAFLVPGLVIVAPADSLGLPVAVSGPRAVVAGTDDAPTTSGVVEWSRPEGTRHPVEVEVPALATVRVSQVSAGHYHSLALVEGRVIAWGAENVQAWGQLNVPPEATSGVTAVSAGGNTSLALKNGAVLGWGTYEGESQEPVSIPADATSGVSAISAGQGYSLALKDGRVIAWGPAGSAVVNVPSDVLSGVTAISAGSGFALALKEGRVIAWGDGPQGQTVVPEEALSGVTAISAGMMHALALKGGRVIAWGQQDGVPTDALSGVTAIAASDSGYSLAVRDGQVVSWGWHTVGFDTPWVEVPVGLAGVTAVDAGMYHALALKTMSVPSGPLNVMAVAGQPGTTRVSWSPPASDGNSTIYRYTVVASPGGRTCTTAGATSCEFTNLDLDTAHTFAVIAHNVVGASPASISTADRTAPLAPGGVAAMAGSASAEVTWQVPASDGRSAITDYVVTASPSGASCTTSATSCVVTGLTPGGPVTFTVIARNRIGSSPASAPSAAVIPLKVPMAVVVKSINRSNRLYVNVNPNKGAGYWTFRVQKRTGTGLWKTLTTTYKTYGRGETRTLNLKKGTYRVVVIPKYGHPGTTSAEVRLKR